MARNEQKQKQSRRRVAQPKNSLPFTKKNYQIFGAGILLIVIGYIFMMQGPVDSFMSLTLSPIILSIAYMIVIPYAIMYKEKTEDPKSNNQPT